MYYKVMKKKDITYRKIESIKPLPGNPRTITKEDMERLKESIQNNADYFEAHPIVLSDRTGELVVIDGNQRLEASRQLGLKEVPSVLLTGLTEEREQEIIIRANVNNGKWDVEKLMNFDTAKLLDWGLSDIDFGSSEEEVKEGSSNQVEYTKKIEAPVYTPKSEQPPLIAELYDDDKYNAIVAEINVSDVPDDVKAFLRVAASRYIVFDYGKIAEYYAHASKDVQEMMERSALVIIDFDNAIANGYAQLKSDIYQQMLEDTDPGEEESEE